MQMLSEPQTSAEVELIGPFRNAGFSNFVFFPGKFYGITNKGAITKEGAIDTLFQIASVQYQLHA